MFTLKEQSELRKKIMISAITGTGTLLDTNFSDADINERAVQITDVVMNQLKADDQELGIKWEHPSIPNKI